MREWVKGFLLAGVFLILYAVPLDTPSIPQVLSSGLGLLGQYARLHVLTCLVPALFIAGTIAVFVKKEAVLRLLGPRTKKIIAYPVAGLSGGILAVCSCTILPLFAGIYRRGAGIGPAVAFLFTGPAINITAILLTSSVLGWEFALARLAAAMVISVVAGLVLAWIFRTQDSGDTPSDFATGMPPDVPYPNGLIAVFLLAQLLILVLFSVSLPPGVKAAGILSLAGVVVVIALRLFAQEDNRQWMRETWNLSKKILPFLFAGVFLAGILESVVPQEFVAGLVGGNTVGANMVASLFGTVMYFATLTEVPIIQSLLSMGMGKGPALTLLLTGTTLSLPSMIVLFSLMGKKQASIYVVLIVLLSSVAGWAFGAVAPS